MLLLNAHTHPHTSNSSLSAAKQQYSSQKQLQLMKTTFRTNIWLSGFLCVHPSRRALMSCRIVFGYGATVLVRGLHSSTSQLTVRCFCH